ncbi:MFS transporter [Altererythrobacter sp. MF3-039]|uniref:MFS transporter n=1 Tax=Altererythrobacter sp. MF3-039 TaxID=3252901 RepID=UPI00390CC625
MQANDGAAVPAPEKRLSIGLKTAYGSGAAAFGIKNNGFDYFLLLFYGTVVGLEPGLVGLAILIALCFDAISDPLVGYWSDNFHSRWGRRHPFMYAAAVPVALSYFLLWSPPDWSDTGLFFYLVTLSILIRTFITFFETPSSSLLPELTPDYEERTTLQSYRLFFGWSGGNLMSVLMFGVILTGPLGMRDQDAYQTYGILASVLIFLSIMISALGTHSRIPTLSRPVALGERFSLKRLFSEMFETLSERSFIALFWTNVFGSISTGLAAGLGFLLLDYFWEFSQFQKFIWTSVVFFSAFLGFLIAPPVVRWLGKKRAAVWLGIFACSIQPLPVVLRLFDLMPENGDPVLFPMVVIINTFDLALIIALQAVIQSMIADLVESNQLRTGRRTEGVYYAAITFTRKTTQGLGVFAAGIILTLIAFPQGAEPGTVNEDIVWKLGAFYAPTLLVVWSIMLFALSRYKIDKAQHEENLRKLAAGA